MDSSIGAAIYEVLFVFFSYPNDDTETATFDRTVRYAVAIYVALFMVERWWSVAQLRLKIQVSVDGWLKHSYSNTRKRTLRQLSFLR